MKVQLTPLRISNGALSVQQLPSRLKVLNWGENPNVKGLAVRVSERTVAALPGNQQSHGFDRIALDFEHNTVPGTPAFLQSVEPRRVAAFGRPAVVAGEGLYLEEIEYTPSGRELAREFCDLSPAPLLDAEGNVVMLHSVALCRQGAVEGLSFFSVDLNAKESGMDKLMAALRKAFGLDDKADEAAVGAAMAALHSKIATLTAAMAPLAEQLKALGALPAALEGIKSQIATLTVGGQEGAVKLMGTLTADLKTLQTQVATLSAEVVARDREAIVAQAAREGKVVALSADALAKLSIAELKDHVTKLPVTVPLSARTPEHVADASLSDGVSEQRKKICENLGVRPEAVFAKK